MEQYYIIPKTTIDDIEDSIQRKRGSEAPIEPSEMPLAIDTIPSSVDGTDVPVGGIYLTKPDSNGNPTEAYIIGWSPNIEIEWGTLLNGTFFPYLTKITFEGSRNITKLANRALFGSRQLQSVSLPNSITEFGQYSMNGCFDLHTINFPNALQKIGGYAFVSCHSLTTANFPDGLNSIEIMAFYQCTTLHTMTLPSSLHSIDSSAFNGCTSLQNVTIENGFNCNNLNLSASTRYSVETMVSWFEALADRTGQTSFKLTIGSTNLNKLTAEQKAIATNKNWTLA